ncbi:AraC family transcriptional regulator [Sphingobacterium sp. HMA12]|uniref:helix-turn-helix domain-containing protein n=1 Tax=Sphingobacterium sp. HMA12 TaxID=2050894 RepID=UPI000CEA263E|nr:AraC family transcriptional regulator [Sphingobacterium sp. HMA12]
MNAFLMCFSGGACFLFSFMLFFYPHRQHVKANRWLALFVFLMGSLLLEVSVGDSALRFTDLRLGFNALQFMMAPSLLLSTIYFVNPARIFVRKDLFHFLPLLFFVVAALLPVGGGADLMITKLFPIGSADFLVRDLLPLQLAVYVICSYLVLIRYKKSAKTTATFGGSLNWLHNFLLILSLVLLFWINDALIQLNFMLKAMPLVYTSAVFFMATFSSQQHIVMVSADEVLSSRMDTIDDPLPKQRRKEQRMNQATLVGLADELDKLVAEQHIYLDSELSLPRLAEKLHINVHDASYLINEVTGHSFYNFINCQRVEQAKRLLVSGEVERLNMVGIAFASGFNSKTAFNTAFKKWTGMSPTQYVKSLANPQSQK